MNYSDNAIGSKDFSEVKVFLFDLDGTLVNSSDVHLDAFQKTIKEKLEITSQAIKLRKMDIVGKGSYKVFKKIVDDDKKINSLIDSKRKKYEKLIEKGKVKLFEGAWELLELLKEKQKNVFIVTASSYKTAWLILEKTGLKKFFKEENVITSDDKTSKKEIFQEALRRSQKKACDALVIEDSKAACEEAAKIEVHGILVNQGPGNSSKNRQVTITHLYDDIKHAFLMSEIFSEKKRKCSGCDQPICPLNNCEIFKDKIPLESQIPKLFEGSKSKKK